ncbi:MAG: hypothetical protein V1926_02825 [Candidatus Peregrinibacteria bacterium]
MPTPLRLSPLFLLGNILLAGCTVSPPPAANQPPPAETSSSPVVGGDRDVHGCIGSAGYSWCGEAQKCLRIWEDPCNPEAASAIGKLLEQKYKKQSGSVTARIVMQEGDFATGSVSFAPGAEGGIFLAKRTKNAWTLAFDGNGAVPCGELQNTLGFPPEVLKNFCDE